MIFMILPNYDIEDDLLHRLHQQDQLAIIEVYENYFTAVYHYIRLKVGDPEVAEDLASDVFLALIDTVRQRKTPHTSLRGWLFKVARNHIAQHHDTHHKINKVQLGEWMIPATNTNEEPLIESLMHDLSVEQVMQALENLPDEQQNVIIFRFGQALSIQETADIMGKTVSAIKSLQFRAIDALRQVLSVE